MVSDLDPAGLNVRIGQSGEELDFADSEDQFPNPQNGASSHPVAKTSAEVLAVILKVGCWGGNLVDLDRVVM